jgi:hypothetical protein
MNDIHLLQLLLFLLLSGHTQRFPALSPLARYVYARMLAHQLQEAAGCAAETPLRQLHRQLNASSAGT